MTTTATSREIYVIGSELENNREAVIIEAGETTDLPATAKYTYADGLTQFPYTIA